MILDPMIDFTSFSFVAFSEFSKSSTSLGAFEPIFRLFNLTSCPQKSF